MIIIRYAIALIDGEYFATHLYQPGSIQPPDKLLYLQVTAIKDLSELARIKDEARQAARQLGIPFVNNLDPDPD